MSNNKKFLKLLEKHECVYSGKDIKLSSGDSSSTYYDIKKAAGIPELFSFILEELKKIIPENASIVAVSTGGIPYGAALANIYKTNFAYVRETKKDYGMNKLIEGHIDYHKHVYIIDDVCTTGKSIIKVKDSLIQNQKFNLVCVINRGKSEIEIKSVMDVA